MKKFHQLFLFYIFSFLSLSSHSEVLNLTIVTKDLTCNGSNDGEAYVDQATIVSTGTGPYTYRWIGFGIPGGFSVVDTIRNLRNGFFNLDITDQSDGVTTTFVFEIKDKPPVFSQFSRRGSIDVSCFGVCDGKAFVRGSGGTPFGGVNPYLYQWDDPMMQTTDTASNLCVGTYNVTITDANGCTGVDAVTVDGPTQVVPNVTKSDIDCFGNMNGSGTAVPSGGVPPYTYSWSSDLTNNTTMESGLSPGTYTLTVTDNDGCTGSQVFSITEPALLTVAVTPDDVDCFGEATGSATATVNGGTLPYTFNWGSGNTSDDFVNGLPANNYTVTVTDANNCVETQAYTINTSSEIIIDLDSMDVDCNGNSTGSVSHTISGGTPPYNWTWSSGVSGSGATGQSTGLQADTYVITVTDALSCVKIDSITVNEPTILQASIDGIMNPSCVGGMDGEIDISITGGTPPYTTLWSDLSPDVDRNGLTAGSYTVQVTDNNGCQISADTVLVNPPPILPNVDTTDVRCRGGNDGTATATPSGGSGVYVNYRWSSDLTNNTPFETGLTAGTYTVTITDSDGCTGSETFVVNEPATLFTINTSSIDADCFGNSTGSVTAMISGGDPIYTFLWDDPPPTGPSTTATVNNLPAGTYNVTATDGNGCQRVANVTIGEPNPIVISLDSTDVDCNGQNTGSISINISGGAPIFNWTLTGGNSGTGNQTVSNLFAGLYRITVTDANNCTAIDSIEVNEPPLLQVSVDREQDPLCTGNPNGEIDISASGGTTPYTFEWNDMSPLQNRTGLTANTYTVTVTDNQGCTIVASSTLTDPPLLTAVIDSLENASCNGFSDGFLRVLASGGTGLHTYSWSGPGAGPTTPENPGIPAGTYTVTVSDLNGCQVIIDTTITEPSSLVVGATASDASCAGAPDGTATASQSGGTPPYSWTWSTTPAQTTQTATGLIADTYTVTVTDNNGCLNTATVNVGEPAAVTLSTNKTDADCNGAATGTATVIPAGGTPPLSFLWNTVPPQTTATATGLVAGTYMVTVTDNNSCNSIASVTINEPTAVSATITSTTNPTCNGIDNGSITADGSGGTAPSGYSFQWSTVPVQTTPTISGLSAGTYTVTVSDDNNCTDVTSFTLVAPPSVIVSENINNVSCFGGSDGNIKLNTTGGTPPYTYNWNPLSTMTNALGDSAFNLIAGTYTATVLDNNGCFITTPYVVTEPASALISTFDTIDVSCNGFTDGSAKVNVMGGTPPYSYDWEGTPSGDLTDSIFNLAVGTYRITITDNGGCTKVDSTEINEPNTITILIDTTINVACNGDATGGATVTASGGDGSFNYTWSFMGSTGPTISGLTAGTYTVTATDGNNCFNTLNVIISEPDTLRPVLRTQNVSCGSTMNGFAVVDVTGGAGNYMYEWSPAGVNGQFTDSIFDLTVGNYSVTVTDQNNCDSVINFSISSTPSNFTYRDSTVNDSCGGACNGYIEILNLAGGSAPYSFMWSRAMETDAFLSNVCAGTYTVTITDNSGCDSIADFTITEPNVITANVVTIPDTCISGVGSASISGSVSGGTMPFTFDWGNGPTSDDFVNNLSANNYNLTISDANSCEIIIPFTVGNVAPFTISFITSDVSCNGLTDGTLQVSTVGATNPVTYNWEDGLTGGANPPPVGAGSYEITVTDANGCAAIDTAIIGQPDPIGVTVSTVSESCVPGNDGSATAIATGGVNPLTYDWGNGPTLDNFVNNRPSGFYRLTITDANGCQELQGYNIGVTNPFSVSINTTDASCNGGSDGIIDVQTTGGTTPFTFEWTAGSGLMGQMPTNAPLGSYRVTITDATGCSVVRGANVGEANPIDVATDTLQDESCTPGMDGFAKISVSGGTSPYTLDWDPTILPANISPSGDSVFNLSSGPYNVTITDNVGCSRISAIFIDQGSDIVVTPTVNNPSCFGGSDGSISIGISGGAPPYAIEWFDMSTSTSVSGLNAGNYAVTITDNATPPCTKVELFSVQNPDPIIITNFSTTLESCNPSSDGTATVSAQGGTGSLTFDFSSGTPGPLPNSVEGLTAGTYTVTVSDANSCQNTGQFTIQAAQNFTVDIDSVDATCGGGDDGELFTTITGGVNPYSYNWDGGMVSGADPKNLAANTYTLTVTDAFGCTAVGEGTINEPLDIMATFSTTDESCFPSMDGSVTITPINGQGNYTYDWGNGFTPDNFANNLTAGNYNVTVTDDSMCIAILPYSIGSSAPFILRDSLVNVNCAGDISGEIYLTVSNLSGPIPETYLWSSNVGANTTAQNQIGLAAGTYSVTVTDPNNGCFDSEIFILTEPDTLRVSGIVINAGCQPVADDGSIDITVTGGTTPYTYNWDNGPMTEDISGLLMGSYTVTVTDTNQCQVIETFIVGNAPQVMIDLDSIDVSCSGAMDGSATVVASGGALPYTYRWSNMGSTSGISGLSGGMYTVTVTDNAACSIVDSIMVNESVTITNTLMLTDENCIPGNDGTATATPSGGTPPYTYDWGNGNVLSNTESGLTANTYTVTITDLSGCFITEVFTINSVAPFDVDSTTTHNICAGDSMGTIDITVTGNVGPITYMWPSPLPNTEDQMNLPAGIYTVTITDIANGCTETVPFTITEPDSIKPMAVVTPEDCNPGGNGSILISPTGGDGSYMFSWTGPSITNPSSEDQVNLSAGKYFLTITDGNNCTSIDSFDVQSISSIIPNLVITNNGCNALAVCIGTAKVNPMGGASPYAYAWAGPSGPIPSTMDSIGSLCGGMYTVTITDNSGCDTTLSFEILSGGRVLPNPNVIDESCNVDDDGQVSVTPSQGMAPYTYEWAGSSITDSLRTGLSPGSYTVTITDAVDCDTTITLTVGTEQFDYSVSSTDVTCGGSCDGTAAVSLPGGSAGFTFLWSTMGNTQTLSNLCDGKYYVTITNTLNNCMKVDSVVVNPTSTIIPNENFSNETCNSFCDGSIDLAPSGGAGGYSYTWNPSMLSGPNVSGLCVGTYSVTITDVAGCDTSLTFNISSSPLIIATVTTQDLSCGNTGSCDGRAFVTASNGTPPYIYDWPSGVSTVTGAPDTAINLCSGPYTVTISDAGGCSIMETFNINGPSPITAAISVTNSTCNIPNGELSVVASGGSGNYSYEWFDAMLTPLGTGTAIVGLQSGAYSVVVTDDVGCSESFNTSVNDIGSEVITISGSTDVSCFGGNDGSATVSFTCTDPGCTVEWFDNASGSSLGINSNTATGLTAGDYFVEVINNSGCKATAFVTINEPTEIQVSQSITNNSCDGGSSGAISLSVSGGTGNFSFIWSPAPANGQGTNLVSGLSAGTYFVTIRDNGTCDTTLSYTVSQPLALSTTFTTSSANCNMADGTINAVVTGGTVSVDYDYQWFDGANTLLVGETSPILMNVSAGSYALRVRDDNICERRFNVILNNINGPTIVVDSSDNAGCFGENNGAIYTTASGVNSPFTYNWFPNGETTEDVFNLAEGTYTVQVTDALGCINSTSETITGSSELVASISIQEATCGICNGVASINVSGGTAPYDYLWSDGSTTDSADSLCGGNYTVVVTDASGCSKSFDFGVNTVGGPTGETISTTPTSCSNSSDGTATVTPVGGTLPYTYLWQHNGATTNSLNNLGIGTYFLQVADARSCSRTVEVDITGPLPIVVMPQVVGSTCNASDGSILLNVSGGLAPYTYNWATNPNDTNFLDQLPANTYNVRVSDANGCSEQLTITLNNNGSPVAVQPTITDVSCYGFCDGALSVRNELTGVGTSVDFQWLDAQSNPIKGVNLDTEPTDQICAGTYVLELTSIPEGCKSFIPVIVSEPDSITLSSSIIKNISCAGSCDGEIFINTRGGNILYTYSWNDPSIPNAIPAMGLCADTYTVTATDANGCEATSSVTLTDPPVLTVDITSNTDLICSSDCNASATTVGSGGVAPYTFTWSGGQTGPNPNNLCFEENTVTLTDARGCSVTDVVNIGAIDTVKVESFGNPVVCDGDSIRLNGQITGSSISSFGWYESDGVTLFTTTLDTTFAAPVGNYTYILIATSGSCSDMEPFDVTVFANPVVGLPSSLSLFSDETITIDLSNDDISYTYLWTPSEGLSDSSIAEPITSIREDVTYTLLVTDTNGCTYLDSVEVNYSPEIEIPTGITPNGDGVNDVWNIEYLDEFPNASVQIFNRWGKLLFESNNGYAKPWDGTYEGKALPIGTYYYIIDLKDPKVSPITGPITIVR